MKSQVKISPAATGSPRPNETGRVILEAIAATAEFVMTTMTAALKETGNRVIIIAIITTEAVAYAAEADHPLAIAEAGTVREALDHLLYQDPARLARKESTTVGGRPTEASKRL